MEQGMVSYLIPNLDGEFLIFIRRTHSCRASGPSGGSRNVAVLEEATEKSEERRPKVYTTAFLIR